MRNKHYIILFFYEKINQKFVRFFGETIKKLFEFFWEISILQYSQTEWLISWLPAMQTNESRAHKNMMNMSVQYRQPWD